ncbi:MAG: hypothetical protein KAX65_07075 [Caldilineaceae bacterium]|nr:hypothetical protein [Caldilineaceae bacterium]
MSVGELSERTLELLSETLPRGRSADARVRYLLEAEYLRKLGQYRRTNAALTHKYGMSFDAFLAEDIVGQRDYSWDVERDAMEWEIAVGGIEQLCVEYDLL